MISEPNHEAEFRDAAIDAVDDAFEASYVEEYSHLGSRCEEALEGGGTNAVTERRRGNEADIPRTVLHEVRIRRLAAYAPLLAGLSISRD